VIVSLNEIQATAAKAARGCELPVGLAADVGFATRWLCERELPGVSTLLSALDESAPIGVNVADADADAGDGRRVLTVTDDAGDIPVPALLVAPSLVELATDSASSPQSIEADAIARPLLLVPFVARRGSGTVTARWTTAAGSVLIEPSGVGVQVRAQGRSALAAAVGRQLTVEVEGSDIGRPPVAISSADLEAASQRSIANGILVDDVEWERLGRLAWRTYVPVSDQSRLQGAGAGLTDND